MRSSAFRPAARCLPVLAALTVLTLPAAAFPPAPVLPAHAADRPGLHQQLLQNLNDASFVFQGRVERVEYRGSDTDAAHPRSIPHTFVTYRIDRLLRGRVPGATVTLRFIGGVDPQGNILRPSVVPLFDVGDEDILLVTGNGRDACPLAGCAAGRFRLIGGRVYSDGGRELLRSAEDRLVLGQPADLEAVTVNRIGNDVIRQVEVVEPGEATAELEPAQGEPLTPESLPFFLQRLLTGFGIAPPAQTTGNADIKQKFFITFGPKAAPIAPAAPAGPDTPRTPQERREVEALRANGGNPVLAPRP